MKEILIIPDSHANPAWNNDRFEWLGKFIVDRKPDVIVDIGDSAEMSSLSSYDVGTVFAEGGRYSEDINAYKDAMNRMFEPINEYNEQRKRNKKKKYSPRLVKCTGNHERRISKAAYQTPSLYGTISEEDLGSEEYGWEVYPFLKPAIIEDIAFQHYISSGVMGRPVGGENHAASLVKKGLMSVVVGHSHTRDFWESVDASGRKKFGLVVGCYTDQEMHYTSENDRWWRGLVYLHDVENGQAEPEFLHIDYLRNKYE